MMNRSLLLLAIILIPVLAVADDSTASVNSSLTLSDNYQSSSSSNLGTEVDCRNVFYGGYTAPSDGLIVVRGAPDVSITKGVNTNSNIICSNHSLSMSDISTCTHFVYKGVRYFAWARQNKYSCRFAPFGK